MFVSVYLAFAFSLVCPMTATRDSYLKVFKGKQVNNVFETHLGLSLIRCSSKCTQGVGNNCRTATFHRQNKTCQLSADDLASATDVANLEIVTLRFLADCGPPLGLIGAELIASQSSTHTVEGAVITYLCPCASTMFGSFTTTCQSNGVWTSLGTCLTGAQTGFLPDGVTPYNTSYPGCQAVYGTACGGSVGNGMKFTGVVGSCYCDKVCCDSGDCCYDLACVQVDYYYYYNY